MCIPKFDLWYIWHSFGRLFLQWHVTLIAQLDIILQQQRVEPLSVKSSRDVRVAQWAEECVKRVQCDSSCTTSVFTTIFQSSRLCWQNPARTNLKRQKSSRYHILVKPGLSFPSHILKKDGKRCPWWDIREFLLHKILDSGHNIPHESEMSCLEAETISISIHCSRR